ncbi:MAG: hypothetical protein LBF97_00420 [Elusimicrobiota bacterium]|nr:hypothetical protein [Elusimicrobiota bacterium]
MAIGGSIWIYFKYPLLIIDKVKELDKAFYNEIYYKKIGFWQCLFIETFYLIRQNNEMISLFGGNILKIGIKNKNCEFCYNSDSIKLIHRVFDIILTIICSIAVFFLVDEFTKFGIVFGITTAIFLIFLIFRKVILNYILSINIGEYKGYKLNIMYPHNPLDSIFSKIYGFACYIDNSILIHKDVFCGNDALKKYVLMHEVGHLKTAGRKKNFWSIFIFVVMTFLSITGIGFLSQVIDNKNDLKIWISVIIYIIFAFFYKKIMDRKNENDELKADIYAIKVIGKEAVLRGLEIIKSENISEKIRFSGISINRRIEFVREYQEQQLNKTT